MEECMCQYS